MRTSLRAIVGFAMLLEASAAQAAIKTRDVEYRSGEAVLEGVLAWDDAAPAKRPGILVLHEWTGINAYIRRRVEQLAGLGYVAFAADVYGKGVRPTTRQEAAAQAGRYKADRALLRDRVRAGLEVLRRTSGVDPGKIAAIGYCFGGTAALELARSGADLLGVVSFHGGLDTPTPGDARNVRAKLLVLTGADDPNVPPAQVRAFEDEMRAAGVDWQLVEYSGAVHGFTNPDNGADNARGVAYNAAADRRSWTAMRAFFAELFG